MISITWRLFADVAEVAGTREESIEISTDASATVGDALDELLRDRPALADRVLIDAEAEAEAETQLATDINLLQNGSAATCDDQLTDGDELALFPQ